MTDRVNSLTVVLAHDVRDDDVEPLKNAISMMRNVLSVELNVVASDTYIATERVKYELSQKLWDVLK